MSASSVTIPLSTKLFALPLRFPLEHGNELRGAQLAYEIVGPAGGPLVVVQGGISAGRHVAGGAHPDCDGWWPELVGSGKAIDTDRFRVLGVDFLGGPGASTGPTQLANESFPAITSSDQANAIALLLDHLDEPTVAFVGASYGGMVGLAFGARYPERLSSLVAISAADRSHPLATAWRSVQRQIVELGLSTGAAREGLELARALAMTSYRTPHEFAQRFDAAPRTVDGRPRFPVEDYLRARGRDFGTRFDARSFLCLSQAIDLHRIDPASITSRTTLVAVSSDQLVPPTQLVELSRRIAGPIRLVEIDSLFGHDAFLKEHEALAPVLCAALAEVQS